MMQNDAPPFPPTCDILGTRIAITDYEEAIALARAWARRRDRVYAIEPANTHVVALARHDANFRSAIDRFDLVLPDGMPLVWCIHRKTNTRLRDRVYGPTFMLRCIEAGGKNASHFFLGGSEALLHALRARLCEKFPDLKIAGIYSPPFGEWPREENEKIAERIAKSKADFVWIGLGCPKQERWLAANKMKLPPAVYSTVGAAFAFHAGFVKQAPIWMQSAGLEWLFRILSEPRRLFRRYAKYNALFLFYLGFDAIRAWWRRKKSRKPFAENPPAAPAKTGEQLEFAAPLKNELPSRPPQMLHIDLDGAWPRGTIERAHFFDAREWGPRLRFTAPKKEIEIFYETIAPHLAPFTLSGSGDFHHLSAIWLRRVSEPITLVSFDNHPDWDVRPPHWACGGWINRALELPQVRRASVWGCGNFEFDAPHVWFRNRAALRSRRLEVRPWFERLSSKNRARWRWIARAHWRMQFTEFATSLAGTGVYVTVDLDCLSENEAVTNWEQGLFSAEQIAWAIDELRKHAKIIGGDVCGAWSPQIYARKKQRFAARFDHPKLGAPDPVIACELNSRALWTIWPSLTGA